MQFETTDSQSTLIWKGIYFDTNTHIMIYGNNYCTSKLGVHAGSHVDRIRFYFIENPYTDSPR